MPDQRRKNANWNIYQEDKITWPVDISNYMQLAVLMDIRDELQELNKVFRCPNTIEIPAILRAIQKNTARTKKGRAKG